MIEAVQAVKIRAEMEVNLQPREMSERKESIGCSRFCSCTISII